MTEAKLAPHQFNAGLPTDRLRAEATSPPSNQVQVTGGPFIRADGVTIEEIAAALTAVPSGGFSTQGGGLERWDLVTLNPEAGPAAFVVTSGTPQALSGTFDTSIAAVPANHIPIAAVKVDESASVLVISDDIVDLRAFFHEVDKSAIGLGYTPAVLADWDGAADPGDVDNALDQLASRVKDREGVKAWVHKASDFSDLQSAIADLDTDTDAEWGVLVLDADIALSGSVTAAAGKPLRIIRGVANLINLDSGTVTWGPVSGLAQRLTFVGIGFRKAATDTGTFVFRSHTPIDFIDCDMSDTSSAGTDMFQMTPASGSGMHVILTRSSPASSLNNAIFDMSNVGVNQVTLNQSTLQNDVQDRTFRRSGSAGILFFNMNDGSLYETNGISAAPGDIRLKYDGSSLLVGTSADPNSAFSLISGEAHYSESFSSVPAEQVLRLFAGGKLSISQGSYVLPAGGTTLTRSNIEIVSAGRGATTFPSSAAVTTATTFLKTTGTDVVLRDMTFSPTAGGGANTAVILEGFTLIQNVIVDLVGGTEVGSGIKLSNAVDCKLFSSASAVFSTGIESDGTHDITRCDVTAIQNTGIKLPGRAIDCNVDMIDGAASCIGIDQGVNSLVRGCRVTMSAGAALATAIGIKLTGGANGVEEDGATCLGNDIDGQARIQTGIIFGDDGNVVANNHVAGYTTTGILVGVTAVGHIIEANLVSGSAALVAIDESNSGGAGVVTSNIAVNSTASPQITIAGTSKGFGTNIGDADGLAVLDGVTAPAAVVGVAQIYVDVADGDLKVKFGDGFVGLIAADS